MWNTCFDADLSESAPPPSLRFLLYVHTVSAGLERRLQMAALQQSGHGLEKINKVMMIKKCFNQKIQHNYLLYICSVYKIITN